MTDPDDSRQRRRFHRVPFKTTARLDSPQGPIPVSLLDISLQGALLQIPESASIRGASHYRLTIELSPRNHIEMDLELAHREEDRCGFHCRRIDLDSLVDLRRLVELNLGDADLVYRDLEQITGQG